MRTHVGNDRISATIVAGTEAVLIGIDIAPEHREKLLGFSIWKKLAAGGEFTPLTGSRHFRAVPCRGPRTATCR